MDLSDNICHSNVPKYFRGRPAFLTEIGLGWVYIAAEETPMKIYITKDGFNLYDIFAAGVALGRSEYSPKYKGGYAPPRGLVRRTGRRHRREAVSHA